MYIFVFVVAFFEKGWYYKGLTHGLFLALISTTRAVYNFDPHSCCSVLDAALCDKSFRRIFYSIASNTTGDTSGAGTADSFGAPRSSPVFDGGSCCSCLVFCIQYFCIVFVHVFSFHHDCVVFYGFRNFDHVLVQSIVGNLRLMTVRFSPPITVGQLTAKSWIILESF